MEITLGDVSLKGDMEEFVAGNTGMTDKEVPGEYQESREWMYRQYQMREKRSGQLSSIFSIEVKSLQFRMRRE